MANEKRKTVTICRNDYGEYQVPDSGDWYFTDDRDDAIGTAKYIHGESTLIKFRRINSD